jgi:fatty-acyl-CoA synthase
MIPNQQMPASLDWLERWSMYSPHKCALVDGDTQRSLTYRDFYLHACASAHFLKTQHAIGFGDRVAAVCNNELEYVVLFYALQRLGAILVPVNFRFTEKEIDFVLSNCEAKLVISQTTYIDKLRAVKLQNQNLLFQLTELNQIVRLDVTMAPALSQGIAFSSHATENTPVMILYTSGTTGFPKGAVLHHGMLFWNSVNTSLRLNISQNDSAVIFLPLFHTGGWNVLMTPFIHRGATIILTKKFEPDQVLSLSEVFKCTLLFGVPTTMDLMSRSPAFSKVNLQSLRYAVVGGEPMPIALIHTWAKKGVAIRQGYGLTEFGPNVFSLNEEDSLQKIGSIGFPNFYIQVKIVDDHHQDVATNEVGELWLKGPMCMQGYWRNEKATAEAIVDGWLCTGDLVRRDAEGFVFVVGRKKEMFISGGENVYPAEVEKVLRSFPAIREVAVIGVQDEKWGEVGKAFVSMEHLPKDTEVEIVKGQILQHCMEHLAKFKIPKYIQFIGALPKGDSGKVLKKELF